ncbi:1,4-dihydroxy-2-naphthoate polyprenyltransferase [Ursidibacter maritimus]|uniref:1,4-dihydroxy-2-naphthoate octaprenyltransferase n=1 Tax=Ursidibacter maritimus TaxID=1331689 RepID=A0A949WGF5_9PAST|nr:1,4-dihydroxy-2-naphthoate polyprenyltransferase [Ursidibacter maritimus]KAE9541507.1 1,4-dihydroxy-2-naphthoate polyprenyltransferase [Ursidibacter maritimus]MBV6524698.1 1,4-dihydroxy-2-naphthoate polyprenyltransferase [Ursidibacter maritimus]MBV6526049.1 1,4-dihydroxy-2-naphthoate polyprenyltransferase [Ursidibacter maritimus]MBV6528350.1 1,4-dihydroxy-2-naphthoate polyprenyltransferase [Ursidibacter maritimus]MBV6529610.1 1,4-dihydroxy-2-naphthoate polyprenyltransferase [Ursidibacter ma
MNKHSTFAIWFSTARPKTLPLALASIVVGSALAHWAGAFNGVTTFLALLTTVLLQILSNFANDYGDHLKGSDTAERIGPLRAIQQGAISGEQLKKSLYVVGSLAFLSGVTLIGYSYQTWQDLLVFIGLGVVAIIAAITYTVGKKPYGYLGLGDISVLIFFGFLAVIGTFYLQAHSLPTIILLPAFGCGLLAVTVLNINNLRDINQDKAAGKNTLIVRIGSQNGRIYHLALLALAVLSYLFFAISAFAHWYNFLFLLTLPLLTKHALFVYRHKDPIELRPLLGQMAGLALLTNLLFSLGIVL